MISSTPLLSLIQFNIFNINQFFFPSVVYPPLLYALHKLCEIRLYFMTDPILNDREITFILYEFLNTQKVLSRARYAEHSREIFDATIATAKTIAEKYFLNHNAKGDANEPVFDGTAVTLIPEVKVAWDHFSEAGFFAAHYDFDDGGMQLPEVVLRASMAYFNAANIATSGYPFLTLGAANLISTFASQAHRDTFLAPMQDGRFAGTMALTEPGQGSALADIKTIAKPADDGSYRIFGNKMYISGGDQDITENIVHMVLAKIEGAPSGAKGISLFICPKFLVNPDGSLGERNDVALAGLIHKMGYRGTTSTVLNFGEKDGAIGYLVGEPHCGLKYMFQMMNEARIGVGMGAAVLGYQGFRASLDYAKERPQGRKPSNKSSDSTQVKIIEHADVKRMLLAQKVYSEGALAMCLYASELFEDSHHAETEDERQYAAQILDLIIPIVKSYPSKYCVKANDLAIQVLGGAGYTREYPVEQYFRDNRLNPIHEGTEGIQGLDLLGRKVMANRGQHFAQFIALIQATCAQIEACSICHQYIAPMQHACELLHTVTIKLTQALAQDPDVATANATVYLDMFGQVTVAWIWLRQAVIAHKALTTNTCTKDDNAYYQGKLQAAKFCFDWELPRIEAQAELLLSLNRVTVDMQEDWF